MGRPAGYQWQPLGLDSDPVPGDPGRVGQEAQHLASVANQITSQVATLRKIAGDNVECGQHAEVIRSSAGDLADQLDKVVGRYQKVSSALNGWIPDLEKAQSMSLQALNQAEGPYKQVSTPALLPSGNNLTAQQKQDVQNYHTAMNKAQGELDAAKALLNKATSLRDNSASYHAGLINKACDDGVKDSWWDKFKDFISHWAWLINDICVALEVIATIVAVLALIFTGVGILLLIGLVATAIALVGRVLLASTGNGSWLDVLMDAIALATFGVGKIAGSALETTVDGATDLAKGMETAKAASMLDEYGDLMGETAKGKVLAQFLEKTVPVVDKEASTTFVERLLAGGEQDTVNLVKTATNLSEKFGDSVAIKAITGQAQMFENILRVNFAAANGASFAGLAGAGWETPSGDSYQIPAVGPFIEQHFGEPMKMEDGLSTGTANSIVDGITVVAPPVGLPLQGFRLALGKW